MSDINTSEKDSDFQDENVYNRIPQEETYSWLSFLMVFIGMWTSIVAISAGIDMGQALTPWRAATGIFLGYMIAMIIGLFVGLIGLRERVPTGTLLERPFGITGSILPLIILYLTGAVFIGVQADAVVRIILSVISVSIEPVLGPITNRAIVSVLLTSLMMFTAYRGFEYIKQISWISMPLYMLAIFAATALTVTTFSGGIGEILTKQIQENTFEGAVFLGLSLYAGFSAMLADVSRFVKNRRQLYLALGIGYPLSSLIPISGVIMGGARGAPYWQLFSSFGIVFGIFAAIAFFMAQWTTNDNNAFTAGLALSNISGVLNKKTDGSVPYLPRSKSTIIPIVMGIILAGLGSGATQPLLAAVGAMGSWLPPMAGILVGHYHIVERYKGDAVRTHGLSGLITLVGIGGATQLQVIPWAALTGFIGAIVLYSVVYIVLESNILKSGNNTAQKEPIQE